MAENLIAELKRRRVFRVVVGYGLVTFALLQVVEPIQHGLHLPDAMLTYLVIGLGGGFPVAVMLAWAFDVTSKGIERTPPVPEAPASMRGLRLRMALLALGSARRRARARLVLSAGTRDSRRLDRRRARTSAAALYCRAPLH